MPVVTKQLAQPPRKKANDLSVIGRIKPVAQVDSGGLHICIFGRCKTGKTRLVSTFTKPLLIIGTEDGTRSIRNVKGVDFVLVEDSEEINDLIEYAEAKRYASVALDTASALQDLLLREVLGLKELPPQKSWGMANRDQYTQVALKIKTFLQHINSLKCNVAITAHERNFNEDNDSDLLNPFVGPAVSPSAAHWMVGAFEYNCHTFIRPKQITKESMLGGKKMTTTVTGKGFEYCLGIGPNETFATGFRVPTGCTLPELIIDPTFDKIKKIANGE